MLPDASGALVDDGCVICKGKEHSVSKDTLQQLDEPSVCHCLSDFNFRSTSGGVKQTVTEASGEKRILSGSVITDATAAATLNSGGAAIVVASLAGCCT